MADSKEEPTDAKSNEEVAVPVKQESLAAVSFRIFLVVVTYW